METSAGRRGATATAARDPLLGRLVDGRYRIRSKIARGGMATVYLAVDERLDREIALKVMHSWLAEDEAFVARFQREARAAARLTHPHVVSVYDQGEDEGLVYLAMEYVPGRTVRDVLRQHQRLTCEQALTVLDPVLQALDAAHRAGFVHRDIKPENVLLGDDGSVKVADFGLARAISAGTSTATQGVLIGTVAYLSPEQVERGVADARSDVYGCGILLYEMLTGAVPFAGETPLAVAYQHVNAAVPRPSTIQPSVHPRVDELVARATRRDPDERWPDATAFLDAVRETRAVLPRPRALDLRDGASTVVVPVPTGSFSSANPMPVTSHPPAEGTGAYDLVRRPTGQLDRPAPRRRRRGGLVVLAFVLALAVVVGLVGWWFGSGRSVAVPAVVGKTMAAAQSAFADSGLTLERGPDAYSETVKPGLIVQTDPPSGSEARTGTTVVATVSAGPERHAVPGIVAGTSVADATTALQTAGLTVAGKTKGAWSETVDEGLVVGTDPAPGTGLRRDAPVTLILSKGRQPIEVRDLSGMTKDNALAWLAKKGLKGSVSDEEYSKDVDTGRVISSNPGKGATLHKGDPLSIVVSKGPPPVQVPSLFQVGVQEATNQLKALGFKVKVSYAPIHPFNNVYWQSVGGGDYAPYGSTIELRVA